MVELMIDIILMGLVVHVIQWLSTSSTSWVCVEVCYYIACIQMLHSIICFGVFGAAVEFGFVEANWLYFERYVFSL
ncbi:13921_t:CDS:2 [Dentiscutata heterogama]|uniref:13921_t:CDS:1 n=1 Tax=Dentiscutata heterogama TaxID=1316150 RepID=A0ACA9JVW6_9GLOM|nr:13921_t:CDS:2 [Dentiscutata heterogama]